MCRSMVDIQSATAEIRRGKKKTKEERKKKERRKIETIGVKYNGLLITMGGHNYTDSANYTVLYTQLIRCNSYTPHHKARFKFRRVTYLDKLPLGSTKQKCV